MSRFRSNTLVAVAAITTVLAACGSDSVTTQPPPGGGGQTPVASVAVTPGTGTLTVGGTLQVTAAPRSATGTALAGRTVAWTSSAGNVAAVSGTGLVTAVAAGTANITATSEGKSGVVEITVTAPEVPVARVTVAAMPDTIEAWDAVQMQATLHDAGDNVLAGRAVRWTSSNDAVATIDNVTGMLTGRDRGTVTITATSEGKTGTATRVVVIRYRSISAGTMHACDIASGGLVWCWGLNGAEGRIGQPQLGATSMSAVPVRLPGDQRFVQLSTYGTHSCGVARDGKAWCWGANTWDRLGGGTAAAQSFDPVPVSGGLTFTQVSVGGDHSCGIATAGSLHCWGHNDWRQLGANAPGQSAAPIQVAAGTTFRSVSAGSSFTCAVTTGLATLCWGASGLGQLGDGGAISYGNTFRATPAPVTGGLAMGSVASGQQFACGVSTTGQAYCWGNGAGGALGNGATGETSTPVAVVDGHVFRSISTGSGFACAVTSADVVWCWGRNESGQLGSPVAGGSTHPVRVGAAMATAEVSVAGIATGHSAFSCSISKDRLTTRCWGRNDVGQLGSGTTSPAEAVNSTPTIVAGQKPL